MLIVPCCAAVGYIPSPDNAVPLNQFGSLLRLRERLDAIYEVSMRVFLFPMLHSMLHRTPTNFIVSFRRRR